MADTWKESISSATGGGLLMAGTGAGRGPMVLAAVVMVLLVVMGALAFTRTTESPATASTPDSGDTLLPSESPVAVKSDARARVTGWMPYWATSSALDAVLAHEELFEDVSPFWFQVVSANGVATVKPYRLSGGMSRETVRSALADKGIRVIPSIVDDSPARFLASQLRSPKKRAALVRQLSALAVAEKFDGLDLDLENFAFKDGKDTWAKTRPAWVSFVKQLSTALKANGKVLTVTTPPIYNRDYTPSSGYWVYDWESIAPYAHRLRVMTYDYSFDRAGPIGPLNWAEQVMDYATSVVPARKVEMGAPAYGRNWVTRIEGECPASAETRRTYLNMATAAELATIRKATPKWDATAAESTYSYSLSYSDAGKSCTVYRTVWFPTPQSLEERSASAAARGLGGVAIWSLNEVSPAGWEALTPAAP